MYTARPYTQCGCLLFVGLLAACSSPGSPAQQARPGGEGMEFAALQEVNCRQPRTPRPHHASAGRDSIVEAYAKLVYEAGSYQNGDNVELTPHQAKNGVHVTVPPAKAAVLWINHQMCPGPHPELGYFYRISTLATDVPVGVWDSTWVMTRLSARQLGHKKAGEVGPATGFVILSN